MATPFASLHDRELRTSGPRKTSVVIGPWVAPVAPAPAAAPRSTAGEDAKLFSLAFFATLLFTTIYLI